MRHSCVADGVVAGGVAAIVSGAPSTVHALARRRDPFEAALAAGSMLLHRERRRGRLLVAAVPVHLALSVGWGVVLSCVLRERRAIPAGAAAGLAIAALDLGLVARLFPRVRALPLGPQLADHAVYGAAVGAVLRRRRRGRSGS